MKKPALRRFGVVSAILCLLATACNDDDDAGPAGDGGPPLDPSDYTSACLELAQMRADCGIITAAAYQQEAKDCVQSLSLPPTWCDQAKLASLRCQADMTCEENEAFPGNPGPCAAQLSEEMAMCEAD